MSASLVIQLSAVIVLGVSAQWIAWRVGLPSILLLLLLGFLAGPIAGLIDTDALFGDLLIPVVSLSVALILYEGGLTLHIADLPAVGSALRSLVSVGALLTWAVTAIAAHLIFKLDLALSTLLGALLVVTGPTVIGPMLRHIRPTGVVGPTLKWESILIDPIGAILAVFVYEVIVIGDARQAAAVVSLGIFKTLVFGGGLGVLAALALMFLLHRYWIPDFLQNAVSLMFVVAAFTISNALQHESGLLAATAMGIVLANQKLTDIRHIVEFKENLRVLLISSLFILLAARLELSDLTRLAPRGLLFVAVLVLIARPLSVLAATIGTDLKPRERLFLAWMAPRGIVAAAVASIFALRLEQIGHPDANMLVPITFLAIIGTVAVYGLTGPLLARRLNVADANPQGFLILGAHAWARALATALKAPGLRVLLVDTNRANIAEARMAGLDTYSGSILAEYALDEIDLGGIGRLLALTPNDWINALAVQRLSGIFGRAGCYQLPPQADSPAKKQAHKHLYGRWLFDTDTTYGRLAGRTSSGATFKLTRLSDEFTYEDFRELYGPSAIPLFLITESGTLDVITAERANDPQPGQTLLALVDEPEESQK